LSESGFSVEKDKQDYKMEQVIKNIRKKSGKSIYPVNPDSDKLAA